MFSLQEPSVSRCVFRAAPADPCRGTSKTKNSAARQAPARPHEAASLSRGGRRKSPNQALTAIRFLLKLFSAALRDGCVCGGGSNQPNVGDGEEGKPGRVSREASSAKVSGPEAER